MSARAAAFLAIRQRVLDPLFTGEAVRIGPPLGAKRIAEAAAIDAGDGATLQLGARTLDAVEDALLRRLRRLLPMDSSWLEPAIEPGVVCIAGCVHDVLAGLHPDLRSWVQHRSLRQAVTLLEEVPEPTSTRIALLRYGWLGLLWKLELPRTDVRWWTGQQRFLGRKPPPRMLAWPELRRVSVEADSLPLLATPQLFAARSTTLASLAQHALAVALGRDPLSDLLLADRRSPPFVLTDGARRLLQQPAATRLIERALHLLPDGGSGATKAWKGEPVTALAPRGTASP